MIRDILQLGFALALVVYGLSAMTQAHADSTTICTKTQSGVVCTTYTTAKFPRAGEE